MIIDRRVGWPSVIIPRTSNILVVQCRHDANNGRFRGEGRAKDCFYLAKSKYRDLNVHKGRCATRLTQTETRTHDRFAFD